MMINCNGTLLDLSTPKVMGIINVTPDSFVASSRVMSKDAIKNQIDKMLTEGADILDFGAMSSRPGAIEISIEEEVRRLIPVMEILEEMNIDCIVSLDLYRSEVLSRIYSDKIGMINDITAGNRDPQLPKLLASHQMAYCIMHMQGTPENMQNAPRYDEVVMDIMKFFIKKLEILDQLHIEDIIIDPGFGFGKSLNHNYEILRKLSSFQILERPILAGLSRKSMIHKLLSIDPKDALNGSTALHMVALQQGASILRVHDVRAAREVIQLHSQLYS